MGQSIPAQEAVIRRGTPRAGSTPGTEEWMVLLRGRSFSLTDRFAAIRAEPDLRRRRALLDAIAADSRREQQVFATHVQQQGGRILRHHWLFHACTIEVPTTRFAEVVRHPQAGVLSPNEERFPAGSLSVSPAITAPIGDCRNANNHNIDQAHLSLPHLGAGANVAVFDTGVDLDQTGETNGGGGPPDPDNHRAFRIGTGTNSRIIWAEMIGTIDCNSPSIDPWCPSLLNQSARHGTGVAAIAVGQADPIPNIYPPATYPRFAAGHAPGASLLSFSISNPGTIWPTTSQDVLDAVEALMNRLAQSDGPPHVLNISYDLWPDPQHPTQLALDLLERQFDVLVVSSASNEGDATSKSPGFVNGLSVGNVHKWSYDGQVLTTRYPQRQSARGPLFGDHERHFPDLCATGASIGTSMGGPQVKMPLVDDQYLPVPGTGNSCRGNNFGPNFEWYDAAGTSMASPQVAGAAALYRAERPSASALEAKAAILLTTVDPFQYSNTVFPPFRHTYTDRNAIGIGYLRDDLLARYALRQDEAVGTQVTLTNATPTATVAYNNLTPGAHYAIAIAWPRQFPMDFDPSSGVKVAWPNIDLEVQTPGDVPLTIARSDSPRNTYEHLVFSPNGTTATIRVTAAETLEQSTPVFVAARRVTTIDVTVQNGAVATIASRRSIPGYVTQLNQAANCSQSVPDQTVTRTLPTSYTEGYGSKPFDLANAVLSNNAFAGIPIANTNAQQLVDTMDNIFAASEIGASSSLTVRALALRTWAPFQGCTGTLDIESVWMYSRIQAGANLWTLMAGSTPPASPATLVASNLLIPVQNPLWSARGYRTWPIIIPLSVPFTVDPTKALGIWIRFRNGACSSLGYEVDGVADGSGSGNNYAIYVGPGFWGQVLGTAAIFGLIEGATGARSPKLDVYGFPREGATVLLQVRQAAPNSNAVIQLGYTNPNTMSGSCLQLATSDLVASMPVTTSSMGDGAASYIIPAGLLHQYVFVQASTTFGTTTLRSNGVRMTIGGITP